MPDAYGVRCRFPPHPLDVPPLFAFEGDASAALSVLLLARRPAYSALACCATIFAVDRLSAARGWRGCCRRAFPRQVSISAQLSSRQRRGGQRPSPWPPPRWWRPWLRRTTLETAGHG